MTRPESQPRHPLALLADWLEVMEAREQLAADPSLDSAEWSGLGRQANELYTELRRLDPASLRYRSTEPSGLSLEEIWTQNADLYAERAADALADGNEQLATLWTEQARACREGVIALRAQAEAEANKERAYRLALLGLQRQDTGCWCYTLTGGHAPECLQASAALAQAGGES
ncbi:hypothetical protein [Deinococcus kurensis]|uniref:hypothetical protein n=1 Tax=Deinococcus kurensis TaxID=2662757 RepID=UPI0012D2B143|nr:hypothetical protein [Deinococcus kurensis]